MDTIVLDGSNSSIGPEFEYLWTDSDGETISTEIITEVFEVDSYVLTVTDTLTGAMASDTVEIEEGRSIANFSLFSDGILNCLQDTVTLSIELEDDSEEVAIKWIGPGGSMVSNQSEVQVTIPGHYTAEVTVLSNGCSALSTYIVEDDFDTPVALIDQIGIINCVDSTVVLEAVTGSNTDNLTFLWVESGEFLSDSISVEVGPGIYELRVTNLVNGCSSSDFVNVFDEENVISLLLSSEVIICGQEAFLDPTSIIDSFFLGNVNTGFWEEVEGLTIDSFPVAVVVQDGTYTFNLRDSLGCQSREILFRVKLNPEIKADAGPAQEFDCMLNELTLRGSAETVSSNLSFNWFTDNGIFLSSVTQDSVVIGSSGTYRVIATDLDTGCSSEDQVIISEDPNGPIIDIQVNNVSCFGENDGVIDLDISGGTAPLTINLPNILLTEAPAGEYFIQVTDADGCIVSTNVEVVEPPVLILDIKVMEDGSLFAEVSGGTPDYSFFWNTGEEGAFILNPILGTEYTVVVLDANGCEVEDSFVYLVDSVSDIETEELITFPNPANDYVFLKAENLVENLEEIILIDLQGRSLTADYAIIDKSQIQIDLQALHSGFYLIHFTLNSRPYYQKIIKL